MTAWIRTAFSSVQRLLYAVCLPAFVIMGLASAPAARAADILLLVGWNGATLSDSIMKGFAEELGHTVTVVEEPDIQLSQSVGRDLIMISSSLGWWAPPEEFKEIAIPILTWSMPIWSYLEMIQSGSGYVTEEERTDLTIVLPGHPMAAGLEGGVEVCNAPKGMYFGYPTAGGQVVAVEPGSNHPALFGYEIGASMGAGLLAPARRVGIFVADDAATNLSTQGRALVKAAISWSLSNNPPNILSQPLSQTLKERQSATFTVNANGHQPLSYQWLRNGSPISGATLPYYSTPGVTLSDNGAAYRCVVSNEAGPDTSLAGILTVQARGVPKSSELISLSGELTAADGTPLGVGTPVYKDITVKLYTDATAGSLVHLETFLAANGKAVAVKNGRFVLRLGLGESTTEIQDVIAANPDLYAEFKVGSGAEAELLEPRIPVTSPAMAGAAKVYRGTGAPTMAAQVGTLYHNLVNNSVWLRVTHNWVKISN